MYSNGEFYYLHVLLFITSTNFDYKFLHNIEISKIQEQYKIKMILTINKELILNLCSYYYYLIKH